MSIPAATCPYCAKIVPSADLNEHYLSHMPTPNYEEEARILDQGRERE